MMSSGLNMKPYHFALALILVIFLLGYYVTRYSSKIKSRVIGSNNTEETKYRFNIYFIETNVSRVELDYKQLCAIESAARHNPTAKINLISIKDKSNFDYLAKHYNNIQMDVIDVNLLFKDTPLESWWKLNKLTNKNEITRIVHLSDILRMIILYKRGGLYLDLDMYTLASYEDLVGRDSICLYKSDDLLDFNNAYLTAVQHSEFYLKALETLALTYNPNGWFDNGPTLLHKTILKHCNLQKNELRQLLVGDKARLNAKKQFRFDFDKDVNNTCGVYLLPAYVAHPYHWRSINSLFDKHATMNINRFLYSRAVHATNAVTRRFKIEHDDDSQIEFFFRFNCPISFKKILKDEL